MAPVGTGAGAGPTSPAPFTGGASAVSFGKSEIMAAFVGIFGLVL